MSSRGIEVLWERLDRHNLNGVHRDERCDNNLPGRHGGLVHSQQDACLLDELAPEPESSKGIFQDVPDSREQKIVEDGMF